MRITSAERERNTCRGRTEKVRQMEKKTGKGKEEDRNDGWMGGR